MIQGNSIDTIEIRKKYYGSGALMWEYPFVNGKMHGIVKLYYETGVLCQETPCVKGKMHGIVKNYYESGALRRETPFKNGKKHGIVKNYNGDKSNIDRLILFNKDLIVLSHGLERWKVLLKPVVTKPNI